MKIEKTISNQKVTLQIEAAWESISDIFEAFFEEYEKVPVKGFRAGRAPKKIIEQRFGGQIIKETGTQAAQTLCDTAMETEGLVAGSPVSISGIQLKKEQPISFTAEFILMPEFELPDYLGLNPETEDDEGKRDEISQLLLAKANIGLPDEMVEQEMELTGLKPDKSDQENWQAAKERVSLLLILKKIADEDGIEVEERDVEERIKLVARQNGTSASALKQILLPNGGLSRLKNYLIAETVLDYLIENN
ncbi:MAG: trigger factor [Bacteroidota bacterium]